MNITIYSSTTCTYCGQLEDYLKSKNLKFTTKLIDTDEAAQKEMAEVSNGFMGVPFTLITKDDGTRETVLGFDKGKLDQVLQVNQV